MSTIDLFPTKIYKTKYTGNLEELKQLLEPVLADSFEKAKTNNQIAMRGAGISAFYVQRDLHTLSITQPLVEFINKHINAYWKELGYTNKVRPKLLHMWANNYTTGAFIDTHNHAPIPIVGVFYLNKEPGVANLVIENPNDIVLNHQPVDLGDTAYKQFESEIDTESGDLVLFPGYLRHKTLPNTSNKNRIIIGINVVAD